MYVNESCHIYTRGHVACDTVMQLSSLSSRLSVARAMSFNSLMVMMVMRLSPETLVCCLSLSRETLESRVCHSTLTTGSYMCCVDSRESLEIAVRDSSNLSCDRLLESGVCHSISSVTCSTLEYVTDICHRYRHAPPVATCGSRLNSLSLITIITMSLSDETLATRAA